MSTQGEELETSKSLARHLEEDKQSLTIELERLRKELETCSAKMEVEITEKRVLQGRMEDAKMDTESRVAHVAAAKDKELMELKTKLQGTQDERQEGKLALKEAREMLENVESQHQIKLKSLQDELEAVENDLTNTKAEAIKCQRDLEDLVVDAQEKLKAAQAEIQMIRETSEAKLHDMQRQMTDAEASAAASLDGAQKQQRDLEDLVVDAQEKLKAAQAEIQMIRETSEAKLHDMQRQMNDAEASAAASLDGAQRQQRDLQAKTKELEMKVRKAEMAQETTASEAAERDKQMRRSVEKSMQALKQELRKGLLALSEQSYKTENSMADVEVEVAKYSTHLRNWHYLEVSALEREMLVTLMLAAVLLVGEGCAT